MAGHHHTRRFARHRSPMARIDIDLLRYGSRGAVYRVTYDGRMLIAESRVPACDAARGWAGIFQNAGLMRTTGASSTTMLLQVTLRLRRCDARQTTDPAFSGGL